MSSPIFVLDANIIIRAVLGNKVRQLLVTYNNSVDFFTPDVCMEDAEKYLPLLIKKRAMPIEPVLEVFSNLKCLLDI